MAAESGADFDAGTERVQGWDADAGAAATAADPSQRSRDRR